MKISRTSIALFCSLLFIGFVVAPSCLHLFGSDYDISLFIDANEEEEKKGTESVKDIEFRIAEMAFKASIGDYETNKVPCSYYTLIYSSLFTEVKSPPPEQGIA